jgi:hypothetical protein
MTSDHMIDFFHDGISEKDWLFCEYYKDYLKYTTDNSS